MQIEMDAGKRRHRAGGAEQVHACQLTGMLGSKWPDMASDFGDHGGVGLRRDIAAAEMLGKGDHAERDRHPPLDARRGADCVRITLDPHQFGRSAADIEQDGASSPRVDQRRATDHGERSLGLAIDDLQTDPGLGGDAVSKAFGVRSGAAGLRRDQPQPPRLSRLDFVAANAQRRNGAFDRRVADAARCRDSFAEAHDPRERIDHAEAILRRARDQQATVVGAEVQRRINLSPRD